jgi:hypothetical protein
MCRSYKQRANWYETALRNFILRVFQREQGVFFGWKQLLNAFKEELRKTEEDKLPGRKLIVKKKKLQRSLTVKEEKSWLSMLKEAMYRLCRREEGHIIIVRDGLYVTLLTKPDPSDFDDSLISQRFMQQYRDITLGLIDGALQVISREGINGVYALIGYIKQYISAPYVDRQVIDKDFMRLGHKIEKVKRMSKRAKPKIEGGCCTQQKSFVEQTPVLLKFLYIACHVFTVVRLFELFQKGLVGVWRISFSHPEIWVHQMEFIRCVCLPSTIAQYRLIAAKFKKLGNEHAAALYDEQADLLERFRNGVDRSFKFERCKNPKCACNQTRVSLS